MKRYRFALVGCGQIGPRHAKQMSRFGELVAVCDIDPQKADNLAVEYNCRAVYSLAGLLQLPLMIDVISIYTPNYLHASQSIQCLNAGFHVICEKPMTISSEQSSQVLKAVRASGRKFFVVKQNRYNPPVLAVKQLLENNRLGRIHSFQLNCLWNRTASYYAGSWKGRKDLDGGILFTQFSHFVDLLIWFLGEAKSVTSLMGNFTLQDTIEFEDTGCALLTMQNGAIGSIQFTVTSFRKNMEGSISLFGEKGTVKIGGQYLNTLEYFEVEGAERPSIVESRLQNDYGSYQGSMSNHDKVYENVVMALDNQEHDLVEGDEASKTVHLIECIYQSKNGERQSCLP